MHKPCIAAYTLADRIPTPVSLQPTLRYACHNTHLPGALPFPLASKLDVRLFDHKAAAGNTGGLRPALLIDSSTIDPVTAREVEAAAAASSLHKDAQPCSGCSAAHPSLVDAPVSGGTTGASKATLTFMVLQEKSLFIFTAWICQSSYHLQYH